MTYRKALFQDASEDAPLMGWGANPHFPETTGTSTSYIGDALAQLRVVAAQAAMPFIKPVARANAEVWFRSLADQWANETAHLSSQSSRRQHQAYRKIVELGWAAVPMLLGDLQERRDFWFSALREITGDDPVPEHARGDFEEMCRAWLRWGQSRGIAARDVRESVS